MSDHDHDHDHDHDQHDHNHNHNHNHPHPHSRLQVPDANKAAPDLLIAAKYLSNTEKSGVKLRQGQFNGKRVDYFKGKSAINALLRPAYNDSTPKARYSVTTREEARQLFGKLGMSGFFLHVERGDSPGKGTPRPLQLSPYQTINEDWYYMWVWEGSQWLLYLGAASMVAAILAAVMFPLWPPTLRLGVWYLSVGVLILLGLFMGLAVVRLILFVFTMFFVPPGIWIFPNLFEDVGIIESFIPFWEWEKPKVKKSKETKAEEKGDGENAEKQEKRKIIVEEEEE